MACGTVQKALDFFQSSRLETEEEEMSIGLLTRVGAAMQGSDQEISVRALTRKEVRGCARGKFMIFEMPQPCFF